MDSFAGLDRALLARALAGIANHPGDRAELFVERLEVLELGAADQPLGGRLRREEGFAVRLVRDTRSFSASRDGIGGASIGEALRQIARVQPRASVELAAALAPWPAVPDREPLVELVREVEAELRARLVAFPLRLTVRCQHREIAVLTQDLGGPSEHEQFAYLEAETPWDRFGALLPTMSGAAPRLAESLVARFRAREAPAARLARGVLVLGPAAAAVLFHEAVGHALEADLLAASGRPEAAIGVALAGPELAVIDAPGSSPAGSRTVDDEGTPVTRRWLLRAGVVEQPLADLAWAARLPALFPGAGRRASRHDPPSPRMTHLEVEPGGVASDDLLADAEGGLYAPEASRGSLDPATGRFEIELPFAWRIRSGRAAEALGRSRLVGQVSEVLMAIRGRGPLARAAGAGWCAKGGRRLAVWATTPALRLEGVNVGG